MKPSLASNFAIVAMVVALAIVLTPAFAESKPEKPGPFSVKFSTGVEYDSNVAVLELDNSSGEGDFAALVDFGLQFDKAISERVRLKLGYDFSQSFHETFDAFDITTHTGSGDLGVDFGPLEGGIAYQHADASLDGEGFLLLQRASPYLAKLFAKKIYLRVAFAQSDKTFDIDPTRDATADAWSGDLFWFLDGARKFIAVGYQNIEENATDDSLDYDGAKLKAQWGRRFGKVERPTRLKVGLRYESRDYADLAPATTPREDERYGFELELESPLGRRWFIRARYRFNDNRSTLAAVDFDEHVGLVGVGAKYGGR